MEKFHQFRKLLREALPDSGGDLPAPLEDAHKRFRQMLGRAQTLEERHEIGFIARRAGTVAGVLLFGPVVGTDDTLRIDDILYRGIGRRRDRHPDRLGRLIARYRIGGA